MLDTYTFGNVRRISPEAPVPVVATTRKESKAGGAGNVVLNILALGGEVEVCGRVGTDRAGDALRQELQKKGASLRAVLQDSMYQTPEKNRIVAGHQQLLRIDSEEIVSLTEEKSVLASVSSILPSCDVVVFSDYGKGFLTPTLLQHILRLAKEHSILTLVDPKGLDFSKYQGAYMIKPNLQEALFAAKVGSGGSLDLAAKILLEETRAEGLLVTKSEEGMEWFSQGGSKTSFPVEKREVQDVTGAGDTVLAFCALAVGCGIDLMEILPLANLAAGLAVERIGCVQIGLADVASSILQRDRSSKIFREEGLQVLQLALQGKSYQLLRVEPSCTSPYEALQTLQSLFVKKSDCVLVHLCQEAASWASLFVGLEEVFAILLESPVVNEWIENLSPSSTQGIREEVLR